MNYHKYMKYKSKYHNLKRQIDQNKLLMNNYSWNMLTDLSNIKKYAKNNLTYVPVSELNMPFNPNIIGGIKLKISPEKYYRAYNEIMVEPSNGRTVSKMDILKGIEKYYQDAEKSVEPIDNTIFFKGLKYDNKHEYLVQFGGEANYSETITIEDDPDFDPDEDADPSPEEPKIDTSDVPSIKNKKN